MGDFNVLLTNTNKIGGKQVGNSYDVVFGEFFQQMEVVDLPFKGLPYTWLNRHLGSHNIQE